MSPLAMAVLVEQQAGVETVLQHSCRDYRLATLQSSLLGAHAMGVRNLLIVTGDPIQRGEYPDANASVLEVDSIGLTNAVTRLNQGIDIGGQAIGKPTAFHTGVMANPGSLALDEEIRRFMYKVEAGAEFAVTRPIYDVADLELFLEAHRRRAHSDRRRPASVREPASGRVPGQRSARDSRARSPGRAHAARRGAGARTRRRARDRARVGRGGASAGQRLANHSADGSADVALALLEG